ncbi:MAG: hypothetical protein RL150_676 [Candidatus Parcubacteria bacterium]|jgi:hypothetical protein
MKKFLLILTLACVALSATASPRFDRNRNMAGQVIDLATGRGVIPQHADSITSDGARLYYKVGIAEVKVIRDFEVYEIVGTNSQSIADFIGYHDFLEIISVLAKEDVAGFIMVTKKKSTP